MYYILDLRNVISIGGENYLYDFLLLPTWDPTTKNPTWNRIYVRIAPDRAENLSPYCIKRKLKEDGEEYHYHPCPPFDIMTSRCSDWISWGDVRIRRPGGKPGQEETVSLLRVKSGVTLETLELSSAGSDLCFVIDGKFPTESCMNWNNWLDLKMGKDEKEKEIEKNDNSALNERIRDIKKEVEDELPEKVNLQDTLEEREKAKSVKNGAVRLAITSGLSTESPSSSRDQEAHREQQDVNLEVDGTSNSTITQIADSDQIKKQVGHLLNLVFSSTTNRQPIAEAKNVQPFPQHLDLPHQVEKNQPVTHEKKESNDLKKSNNDIEPGSQMFLTQSNSSVSPVISNSKPIETSVTDRLVTVKGSKLSTQSHGTTREDYEGRHRLSLESNYVGYHPYKQNNSRHQNQTYVASSNVSPSPSWEHADHQIPTSDDECHGERDKRERRRQLQLYSLPSSPARTVDSSYVRDDQQPNRTSSNNNNNTPCSNRRQPSHQWVDERSSSSNCWNLVDDTTATFSRKFSNGRWSSHKQIGRQQHVGDDPHPGIRAQQHPDRPSNVRQYVYRSANGSPIAQYATPIARKLRATNADFVASPIQATNSTLSGPTVFDTQQTFQYPARQTFGMADETIAVNTYPKNQQQGSRTYYNQNHL